jgi:hypothetical protein
MVISSVGSSKGKQICYNIVLELGCNYITEFHTTMKMINGSMQTNMESPLSYTE